MWPQDTPFSPLCGFELLIQTDMQSEICRVLARSHALLRTERVLQCNQIVSSDAITTPSETVTTRIANRWSDAWGHLMRLSSGHDTWVKVVYTGETSFALGTQNNGDNLDWCISRKAMTKANDGTEWLASLWIIRRIWLSLRWPSVLNVPKISNSRNPSSIKESLFSFEK